MSEALDTEILDDDRSTPDPSITLDFALLSALESQLDNKGQEDTSTPSSISSIQPRAGLQKMSNATQTYQINGITFNIEEKAISRSSETLYTKEKRKSYAEKERIELLDKIQKKQQTAFHSITISVNDPEKMTNTHSLSKLLAENKRSLTKYDIHDVYTIVVPQSGAFDSWSPNYRLLKTTIDTAGNETPVTHDLFKDYLQLTPQQVANSSKWYSSFIPKSELMQENLTWSLAYYEKNVDPALYAKVHSELSTYAVDERGGPLFLKLLLDRVTTTNEANLKSMIYITETYRIKKSSKGEDIESVVELFTALYDNMASLKNGQLPEDGLKNLLEIFQSTSVPSYNELFKDMERQRLNNEIKAAIDPAFAATLATPGVDKLANNLTSVHYALTYAERVYRTFVQKGIWDEVLQRTPGEAAFFQGAPTAPGTPSLGPTQFQHPTGRSNPFGTNHQLLPIIPWTKAGDCFNCGQSTCNLQTCPHERDTERIKQNRAKLTQFTNLKRKANALKFRKPEPHEQNKRVIDGKPHTYNPNAGNFGQGRWLEDETPTDGQSNNGQPPQHALLTHSVGSRSRASTSNSSLTSRSSDPMEHKLQLKAQIDAMTAEYDLL